ncbi:MAG: ribbon-helix-helix domain-containing protein [Candidatus Bipolaricaulota bacterium]|nr:ribbon-helix-helix domain-containing protein [Candidatus Bipolaricaulota bacterium]MCS7274374.1 ribbon-helix-helix domain-containing protein [Candidatus Bipolaricaulota bacterium]MDW8111561.1 CopG family transcriptional regulator [Candidatus Bipolaricaulota bacterium]MDW8329794.1 CopG family transcriptional regulator [Candidatus Bipolaricaulota bacterium]
MIRKQVYLEHQQEKRLKQLSKKFGQSEAELIRQAIDQALATDATLFVRDLESWEREKAFIRRLMAQKPVHRGSQRWTREDLYEKEC